MSGQVTALRYQQRTQDRVNVFLDGTFAFALPALEAARLKVGQVLSDADVARLRAQDTEQKAYDRALHFLGYRPRSRDEVQRNLAKAGHDQPTIDKVMARLEAHGLVNDSEFARFWVEERERSRPRGGRALRQELRLKGVEDTTIAAALESVDAEDGAYRAAAPRAQRLAALARTDALAFRRKMTEYLLRRGFDYDVVRDAVKRLERELSVAGDPEDDPGLWQEG